MNLTCTVNYRTCLELRKCEKSAIEPSVARIISVVQAERDVVKDLQAKLRETDSKNQELQLANEQLHDDMAALRHQLHEAVAESKFACTFGFRAGRFKSVPAGPTPKLNARLQQ